MVKYRQYIEGISQAVTGLQKVMVNVAVTG